MGIIVSKFGGTSVADTQRIEHAADKIAREVEKGHRQAVVVSAMAGVTNQLVGYCEEVSRIYDAREYDTVVSSGEQVTAGLMAIALQKRGVQARSWLGWQVPLLCDDIHGKARIRDVDHRAMLERMEAGEVAVLAGFQGVSGSGRITTLGRGGSDTSAVALAAALNADRCDIYTDVTGVFTSDPRIVPQARMLKRIVYEEMLEMASLGARVLQVRSVEMAMKKGVRLQVLSSFSEETGSDLPGTLVTSEEEVMEQQVVNGVTYSRDEAKVTIMGVPDIPGIAAKVFGPLAGQEINVDMIVQNVSSDGQATDLTFTVTRSDLEKALKALKGLDFLAGADIRSNEGVAKVSVIGIGMKTHAGVANTMFTALAGEGINIQVISTSEIKISVLIDEKYTELALRTLHSCYGLDGAMI